MSGRKPLASEKKFFTGESAHPSPMQGFLRADIAKYEKKLRTLSDAQLQKEGFQRALTLFQEAATRVPAYRDFLRKNGVNPATIKTPSDFAKLPYTDKKNYISQYPVHERCFDGKIEKSSLIAMSSGTSGAPTMWPRAPFADVEAGLYHEFLYKNLFGTDKKSTLFVIGFPMGVYVSGIATTLPTWLVSVKGHPITVASVGNNKDQVLAVVKEQGRFHEQVVMAGHPFFMKDVVESGVKLGIDWKKHNTKLLFCSEGFSESWRKYIEGIIGSDAIFNTYGSSETLLIGCENPFTIASREVLENNPKVSEKLFGTHMTPYIFQYDPRMRYVETVDKELVYTANSGIPLIRFNVHDEGLVLPQEEYLKKIKEAGIGKKLKPSSRLPIITLHGRSDYTMVFYAANIYPEHIKYAFDTSLARQYLTGRFVMRKDYTKEMDQFLEINIELREAVRVDDDFQKKITDHMVKILQEVNMEYNFLCKHIDKDLTPRIVLYPYQDPKYFKQGLKPKYIQTT